MDFVNIFLDKDIKLFIDPWAIKECGNIFCLECISYINGFFDLLLEKIRSGETVLAKDMLRFCHEVKEIHLGNSVNSYHGLGMAESQTDEIYKMLNKSKAINTRLIQDLEDCALMIDGINRDKISDMVANIIKLPLIKYTQEQCQLHNIETEEVNVGYYWDNARKDWFSIRAELPTAEIGGIRDYFILVPKWIVRRELYLQYDDYFDKEILEFEQARHMNAGSSLVRILKDGALRPPTKKSLKETMDRDKKTVAKYTKRNPGLLIRYKERKKTKFEPIGNGNIIKTQTGENYDIFEDLNKKSISLGLIPKGRDAAYNYEDLMKGILEAIFYPQLSNPVKQYPLADRTKLVDIVFQNSASKGFFMDLSRRAIPSVRIFFECKNYNNDPGNEEVDQLAGRLGVNTGKVGFLLCREIEDRERLLSRCKFIARNQSNYIICLDDRDLINLLAMKSGDNERRIDEFLSEELEKLLN